MTVGAQAMPPTNFNDRAGDFIRPKEKGDPLGLGNHFFIRPNQR